MSNLQQPEKKRMYRVGGVVIDDDYVLLHRAESDDFWSLPGGGCQFMETSEEAIIREMEEEMGLKINVERLLFVIENIYQTDDEIDHVLEFSYLISLPGNPEWYDKNKIFTGHEDDGLELTFRWFHISELDKLTIYPPFLKKGLQSIPDRFEHVISKRND